MDPIIYEIDKDRDAIAIIRNANQPIAARGYSPLWGDALPQYSTAESRRNEFVVRTPVPEGGGSQREIWVLFSSKKLALVSPYCRQTITSNLTETRSRHTYRHITNAQGWDVEALEIVMRIIHGRIANVPEIISLEMLAKIAVVVAHYHCDEAVKSHSDKWISNLTEPLPTCYGRDLVLRLFTSWVFSDGDAFQALTAIAMRESRGPIHTLGLPIPKSIIGAIDQKRRDIIAKLFFDLNDLKKQLSKQTPLCLSKYPPHSTAACCAILPDALVEGMSDVGLDSPPNPLFQGYSIMAIEKALRGFQQPSLSTLLWSCSYHGSLCYLTVEVNHVLRKQQLEHIEGLDVSKFHRHA